MKPHPRIRKAIKWGGAAVTVLLVVVWIGSRWFLLYWQGAHGGFVNVNGGCTVVGQEVDPVPPLPARLIGFRLAGPTVNRLWWWPQWNPDPPLGWSLVMPLWPIVVVMLLVAAAAFRLDTLARRREHIGRCPKCNYDRVGLAVGAKCPECGLAPPSSA